MQDNTQKMCPNLNLREMKSILLDTRTEQKREEGVEGDYTLTF